MVPGAGADLVAALAPLLAPVPAAWHTPADRRAAAVLVPLVVADATPQLLFTLRRADLTQHAGQISFPGGRGDPGEAPLACALREFEEELGLAQRDVAVLGSLPCRDSSTGFHVHPIVGVVHDLTGLAPQAREVEAVLCVPLAQLRERTAWGERGVQRGAALYTTPTFAIGPHELWGLTARITLDLLERLP